MRLSYAAVGDVLDDVEGGELAGVPGPQRRALEVTLLRADPAGAPADPRAIVVGLLSALRTLATRKPLLLAVDDVQWLDSESAHALAFAARRLSADPVRFLLTTRATGSCVLERALAPSVRRLGVGPLTLGATRRLLSERLGLALPRRVLLRIVELSQGNPLVALELGRTLAERRLPEIGEELVMPATVEELLAARVDRLPASVRRVMLAVALSGGELGVSQLTGLADATDIDGARDAGVLVVQGDRARISHPLLVVAARHRSSAAERRALHLELARTLDDEPRRVRHLALAAGQPDAGLAATAAAAADDAAARHAVEDAVELAEHALRLTPPEAPERGDRLLALAEHLDVAGEDQRVTDLLAPEIDSLPPGSLNARAHLLLADGGVSSHADEIDEHLARALAQSAGGPVLRATALAMTSMHRAVNRVERIGEAEALALEAMPAARGADASAESVVLFALAWARSLRGGAIDDLRERYRAVSEVTQLYRSLDRVAGVRLLWRGEVSAARAILTPMLALADERHELASYFVARLHLCELALRTGEWEAAAHVLEEWDQSSDGVDGVVPIQARCRALLAAGRGQPGEAERWAKAAIAKAQESGVRWDELEALRARGIGALLTHEPERAVASLRLVWEHTEREGVEDPGAFPVAPDLVEALWRRPACRSAGRDCAPARACRAAGPSVGARDSEALPRHRPARIGRLRRARGRVAEGGRRRLPGARPTCRPGAHAARPRASTTAPEKVGSRTRLARTRRGRVRRDRFRGLGRARAHPTRARRRTTTTAGGELTPTNSASRGWPRTECPTSRSRRRCTSPCAPSRRT